MKVAKFLYESCLLSMRKLPTFHMKVAYFHAETCLLAKKGLIFFVSVYILVKKPYLCINKRLKT